MIRWLGGVVEVGGPEAVAATIATWPWTRVGSMSKRITSPSLNPCRPTPHWVPRAAPSAWTDSPVTP